MASWKRFEEVEAWQRARELTKLVYQMSTQGDGAKDFGLRDQIRRAAVSIMSNIAEGFERRGAVEFSRFLVVAKASAGEVRSQLYVALDLGYISGHVQQDSRPGGDDIPHDRWPRQLPEGQNENRRAASLAGLWSF